MRRTRAHPCDHVYPTSEPRRSWHGGLHAGRCFFWPGASPGRLPWRSEVQPTVRGPVPSNATLVWSSAQIISHLNSKAAVGYTGAKQIRFLSRMQALRRTTHRFKVSLFRPFSAVQATRHTTSFLLFQIFAHGSILDHHYHYSESQLETRVVPRHSLSAGEPPTYLLAPCCCSRPVFSGPCEPLFSQLWA